MATKQASVEELFKPSVRQQRALKMAIFGDQGSGKSTTAALLAIALAVEKGKVPVFMHDTENGSDFLEPLFREEGVPFYVRKSRSFEELCAGLRQAEKADAAVYIEDSLTSDWNAMVETYKAAHGGRNLVISDWGVLKPQWQRDWIVPMLNSQVPVIACGRVGLIYEEVVRDSGKTESAVTGTKFKAEGEFGYEPSLLVEMESVARMVNDKPVKKGGRIHRASVLKDRTRAIQGSVFDWPDLTHYKKGDYRVVLRAFQPHLNFLRGSEGQSAIEETVLPPVFGPNGQSEWTRTQKEKEAWLEEIENTITLLWPGQDAASKRIKLLVLERLFSVRSWTRVRNEANLGALEVAAAQLRTVEKLLDRAVRGEEEAVMQAFAEVGQRAAKQAAALYQQ